LDASLLATGCFALHFDDRRETALVLSTESDFISVMGNADGPVSRSKLRESIARMNLSLGNSHSTPSEHFDVNGVSENVNPKSELFWFIDSSENVKPASVAYVGCVESFLIVRSPWSLLSEATKRITGPSFPSS
jgi:hypothetical protein